MPNQYTDSARGVDALLQYLLSERQWCDRVIDLTSNTEISMVMIGWKRGLNEAIEQLQTMIAGEKLAKISTPLHEEIKRLQAIIDAHDLCHNLHGKVDARAFADGCAAEQRKLYGCAPDADRLAELEGAMASSRMMKK